MTRHLQADELLRYFDGELSRSATRRIAAHLQSCGSCRADLERIKEEIEAVLDAQKLVFEPPLPPPPSAWPPLEPRLDRALRERSSSAWKKPIPFLRTL